ncbi:MAG: pectinesterase family protein [Clostridia bacterium]|nr:pectinesterase family protein [Clostridia bacterium]
MKISSKKTLSRVLSFVMLVSAMCTNLIAANAGSGSIDSEGVASGGGADIVETGSSIGGNVISVWDFGGVEESDTSLYTNYITKDFLDNFEAVGLGTGKFNAGTFDLGGGLSLSTIKDDRLYYDGVRNYGDNAKASAVYSDGYAANGMWYSNGTGGENRRFFLIDNVTAGTEIKVYTGCSNSSDDMVNLTYMGTEGTQTEEIILPKGVQDIVKFIAKYNGSYKVWFNAAGGKPVVNRIVKTPSVPVTAEVNTNSLPVEGFGVSFKNDSSGDVIKAEVTGNSAAALLTPGYTYTASLTGATGYGFTNESRKVEITNDDLKAGSKSVNMDVEIKETYKLSGSVTGFNEAYDLSKLVIKLIPDADSMADTVTASLNEDLSFEAVLEPDVNYSVSLEGVNDYEVVKGGSVNSSVPVTQNIEVALKELYNVTGKLTGGADVTEIAFVNVDDNYSYAGTVNSDGTYTVKLRAGSYAVQAVADGYKTSGHIVVNNKDTVKDILFVSLTPVVPSVDTSVRDIYVGCEGQVNNFETIGEALEAAKVMNPQTEDERVTVHIAPGIYREQLMVETPYVTFVPSGNGEVKLTWYYGIGYRYYSVDSTGYFNIENAFDKYSKDTEAAKWGVGTYVKNTAKGFKAENITFEASFNKYITDEEITDGVSATGALPERNYALDVTSKAATERSTALIVEADQSEFKNCKMIGSQDTLYMGNDTHTYYKNCMIEGNTDYIFGSGNAVFDGCELRFCGYSDTGTGGYITAGRSNDIDGYMGYLFRACTVTNKEGMEHASGYFGRPWDAGADITFLNTALENADAITAEGWTSMSGVAPDVAKFKEYGTMLADGTPVDTTGRVTGVMTDDQAKAIDAKAYFGGWTPSYYTEDTLPVEFTADPYFSTDGDVLLPATGNTFTVKYSLGVNDDNDASKITYALVKDGNETVIKSTTAAANKGVKITNDMIGSFLKVTVTPCTILGNVGNSKSVITEKEITLGSGSVDTERPNGKAVIFLAGDSTVKDYSAGAINNSGANRAEGSWGEFLGRFVNDNYEVMDYAEGGRSSRTFMDGTKDDGSDKYLDKIKDQMMAGDYLFIQFGHNDSSESYKDRYVAVGTPDENGVYPYTAPSSDGAGDGSFKWYLQQYADAAKAAGATPVMVTPVSRRYFNADGTIRSHHGDNDEYVTAVKQVAEENGILCFDLYSWTKEMYENAYKADGVNGESSLAYRLFAAGEKTHHSKLGGFAIAADLAEMIKNSDLGFANAITAPSSMYITDNDNAVEFIIDNSGVFTGYGRNDSGVFDTNVSCEYWNSYINDALNKLKTSPEIPTETSTEVTTAHAETSTEVTTAAAETSTEAITAPVETSTEATTSAPVKTNSTGSSGAGASSLKVTNYLNTENTEPETETSADSDSVKDNEILPYVEVSIGSKDIVINGQTYTMDTAPYIQAESNSTLVPLRFVAIAISGGNVEKADSSDMILWNADTKQAVIKKNNITAVFTANSNIVTINGADVPMDNNVKAEIRDNRMFVPFRAVGEALKADVSWDGTTKTAYYNKK